jgi:predicted helicase
MATLKFVLEKIKSESSSLRDMGGRFEQLIKSYLISDPKYSRVVERVWMWEEFPYKHSSGSLIDTGIDLVVKTVDSEYWAVQCKFYDYNRQIGKQDIDSFLSTSSKQFIDELGNQKKFSIRLLVTTSSVWGAIAEQTILNQNPPVIRLSIHDLEDSGVDWEKLYLGELGEQVRTAKYSLRTHQEDAFQKSLVHFADHDRGKLIMACGTGKTFTSLRMAEALSGKNGIVLFMVPSIALLGQTLNEWTKHSEKTISSILVCSDPKVNKDSSKIGADDSFTSTVDLALPSSTNIEVIKNRIVKEKTTNKDGMIVVFSTYQSIDVVIEVQKALLKDSSEFIFDLAICDEAHRTTGVTLEGNDESHFIKIHDEKFIKSKKRLYMTATPRLYTEDSKTKAEESNAVLCSMDDEKIYGVEFYRIGFGEAVERDLLSDYKVLVLTVNESDVPTSIQKMLTNEHAEIESDDLSKVVGSINALSKKILGDEGVLEFVDPSPMMRSVAFTNTIYNSKQITDLFNSASRSYFELFNEEDDRIVEVSSKHIDGGMSALERNRLMSWLKDEDKENLNESRILTNVRCLSEGVDVPSLDAILFLTARNSQVDVVQSVGRVMRKSPGKKYGYIIIPIVVPYDVDANTALDNNQRFKVVWSVLNALRAHDDRFNAQVNKIDLNKKKPENILIGQISRMSDDDDSIGEIERGVQQALDFDEFKQAMYAKIVKKVGNRVYWETWAGDVAQIAIEQVKIISKMIEDEDSDYYLHFSNFLSNLQIMINPSITTEEAVEMISQHMITKPVFDSLFEEYSFVKSNPISKALEQLIGQFNLDYMTTSDEKLQGFYESVKMRAAGIDNYEGRQRIILELYERFFKVALPKQTEKLGIVYTPIELVDFMINSAEFILNSEFNSNISQKNVHILDPFTGTGTFLVRMIQSELIKPENLIQKYNSELHGNEIVLLAYYIALINIEQAFLDRIDSKNYVPFNGLVLTDTFQMSEDYHDLKKDNKLFFEMFSDNNHRVNDQVEKEIRLIIGNPPYSIGQKNVNDNNKNYNYPKLEQSIKNTYSMRSKAQQNKGLYDSYIKAFRWASNRISDNGIICFITNGSFIDSNGFDGFRETLLREFSSVYVLNLRGNARTRGEIWAKEGGKIFGQGSRTQIAITILVKNETKANASWVNYYEVDDYLSREGKLALIHKMGSIKDIKWNRITPDQSNDWISQRNESFSRFIPIGDKKNLTGISYFGKTYSTGIVTGRNAWMFNSSKSKLVDTVKNFIGFYNEEVERCKLAIEDNNSLEFSQIVNRDSKKISWTESLLSKGKNYKKLHFDESKIVLSSFRPFYNQWFYFDTDLIERPSNWLKTFPNSNSKNLVISVSGPANKDEFSSLISDKIQDFHLNINSQTFPLIVYENDTSNNLFEELDLEPINNGITDSILEKFKTCLSKSIDKESIFYYVYGVLHSLEYREEFANNLQKELPRIPISRNFEVLSTIGKQLSELHIGFEDVEMYDECEVLLRKEIYEVQKMRLDKKNQTLIYNEYITISKIPLETFDYKIGSRSALEWVVDRYKITVDKDSGILNDPNDYKGGKFIFELVLRIINLSIETVKLVNSIPSLDIIEDTSKDN